METYLGTILLFAGNFAPRGWALCNGQLLSIAQNQALFAILGTTYGGNGTTTFALPNMQGRSPMHWGNGPGLTPRTIGELGGAEHITLLNSQMPTHNHALNASTNDGNQPSPANGVLAVSKDPDVGGAPVNFTAGTNVNTLMANNSIAPAGQNLPHDNMEPYLAVTFIIALEGIFPSRN